MDRPIPYFHEQLGSARATAGGSNRSRGLSPLTLTTGGSTIGRAE